MGAEVNGNITRRLVYLMGMTALVHSKSKGKYTKEMWLWLNRKRYKNEANIANRQDSGDEGADFIGGAAPTAIASLSGLIWSSLESTSQSF